MQSSAAGDAGPFLWEGVRCLLVFEVFGSCLLYTSDAADDMQCVDLGGRRIIKKKFFQAEDGIRDFCLSRGLGDVYKRQVDIPCRKTSRQGLTSTEARKRH